MTFSGISPEAAWWIMAVWFAALGGAVGSFLNVVVYRLPAGKSLVYPPSHCPACQHPIRWYDNVPVVSWFVLRGRCRDCRARISPRYPLVEAVTAGMFLLVGLVEFQSGGANLPTAAQGTGPAELTVAQLAGVSLYHVVLVCTLLAAGLIELDGYGIPRRLVLPVVAVGVLAGALWPPLHPVPAVQTAADSVIARTGPLIGLAAGALLGLILWQALGQRRKTGNLYGPALAGAFLGWQAAVALTAGAVVLHVPLVLTRRHGRGASTVDFPRPAKNQPHAGSRISLALWLAPLSLAWILLWGPIVRAFAVLG